jgi:hypothetical protein
MKQASNCIWTSSCIYPVHFALSEQTNEEFDGEIAACIDERVNAYASIFLENFVKTRRCK